MARLPEHLETSEHITSHGDRVTLTIYADVSAFLAVARNTGPAWDRLLELQRRMGVGTSSATRALEKLADQLQHHRREDPRISAMHAAYDRRRRARRRR